MNVGSNRVLDRLPAEEPCLGALFTSYSFDPVFFEEHVLRAVLRLTSDPIEQAERYHHEARRALQETPVVAIVDASQRRPGRRLPFDLLEVSDLVFHPKSVLLLYRKFARLMVGSGNLTFSGYGGNTEIFLRTDLFYADVADVALLEAFDYHLERIRALLRQPGTQFDLFRQDLRRRILSIPPGPAPQRLVILDSTTGPILQQLTALLPAHAVIESIGMLAPFYERDDDTELDATSVFGALTPWAGKNTVLDVGVAWDNPQVQASTTSDLESGLGQLWTSAGQSDGVSVLRHLVPTAVGPNTLAYIDESGQSRRWSLDEVREAIEHRTLWVQPPPIAFAPHNAISGAVKLFAKVRFWLHPATRLDDGRPVRRPLHAKLLVLSYRSGRERETLVMFGSPNMSRRALLMTSGSGQGNVELALAFRLKATVSLRDLVPELIHAPASAFDLKEREFPDLGRNYALAIDQAIHDPVVGSLIVTWSREASDLPGWQLSYDGSSLASAASAPVEPVTIDRFVLKPAAAEIVLHVDGRDFAVPILVTDLIALPAVPAGPSLGLDELLMLIGRRIGSERAIQIAERRGRGDNDDKDLAAIFGDGFGPTDVFHAWWSVVEDLKDAGLSVSAFRLRLEGALGVGAAWGCMLDAMNHQKMHSAEVWFYGAELLRDLGEIELPPAEDREVKRIVLATFCDRVRKDLRSLDVEAGSRPWVSRITTFYRETQA